jgi:hypothetical protein
MSSMPPLPCPCAPIRIRPGVQLAASPWPAADVVLCDAIARHLTAKELLARVKAEPHDDKAATLACYAMLDAERQLLRAIIALDPAVWDGDLDDCIKTRQRPRGVAFGGTLYLSLPMPNDETPEGSGRPNGTDVMVLATVALADITGLDAPHAGPTRREEEVC